MNEICGEKKKDIQSWEQRDARNEAEVLIMQISWGQSHRTKVLSVTHSWYNIGHHPRGTATVLSTKIRWTQPQGRSPNLTFSTASWQKTHTWASAMTSDTNYPELGQTPQVKGTVLTRLPSLLTPATSSGAPWPASLLGSWLEIQWFGLSLQLQ